jgi:hypothetical protein
MTKMAEFVVPVAGDVGPCRPDPRSMFDAVRPTLAAGAFGICQLEPVLATRGTPLPALVVLVGLSRASQRDKQRCAEGAA